MLGVPHLFNAITPSNAPSRSRSHPEVIPGIVVNPPMSDMSSTDVQVGSDAASASPAVSTSKSAAGSKRHRPSLCIVAGQSVPFPAAATPTCTRHSDQVFAGLRSAPSPPDTARWAPSFSLSSTPHRTHFDSFSSVVEIPRFRKHELNLGIVRGRAQSAAWFCLWATWIGNGLLTAFFDVNIMYMLSQCAMYPPAPVSPALWVFLAVAYGLLWAVSVLGVWLGYGVGFQFYRRWRRARPPIEPIYLSLYANLHLSLLSFDHFCFITHIRLSAWHTPHALDMVPETAHFVVQLLPALVPMAARAGIASVLLISNWIGTAGGLTPDFRFFDPGLTTYARGVVLASCAYVAVRIAAVTLAALTLLIFLARPLKVTHSSEALLGRRDPASGHFPAPTWRDENELQWAWRARTRARIQDAFELCIVRPTRSSLTLEKASLPPPAPAHRRGDSAPRVLSLDFARPGATIREGNAPQRRRKKESTAPLTFVNAFGSGMMADTFSTDVELSPRAISKEIQASARLPRVSEEPGTPPLKILASARPSTGTGDVPPSSHSLASLPITSPLTPTFAPMHPLDAAASPDQTFTSAKGSLSFEVWRVRQPSWRHVSFGSRSSGLSADVTHGTFEDSICGNLDEPLEELMGWSTDNHERREVMERPPRGSAFFGDAPRSRESLASTAILDTSFSMQPGGMTSVMDVSGVADSSTSISPDPSRVSSTFGLDVLHPVHTEPPAPTEPMHTEQLRDDTPGPPPSTPPRPARSPKRGNTSRDGELDPRTPSRQTSHPEAAVSPPDPSPHNTIDEGDLFYQRKRRSTATVGLQTVAVPLAPDFGAIQASPTRSPRLPTVSLGSPRLPTVSLGSPRLPAVLLGSPRLRTVSLGSPLGSPASLSHGGHLIPSPIAMEEVHDGEDRESRNPRLSFTSDIEWLGNGSPRSSPSPSKSMPRAQPAMVGPPPVLQLRAPAKEAPPPAPRPALAFASPATFPHLPPPPVEPAEFGSLRKRRVTAPQFNVPPSPFP
ncbi:hypothetical protein CspeluHIS016_0901540 [Cutaneotrichosporon spelunceum]|uniref:Uncharacterized protein n=1 Tax=Cutaneotrichosporon spelunceum TaxID=1672016 RepID=A0AAD3U0Q5_9TREE|nr:hypothetical protein CspeluHIS016_0901540 [Cutaneotrichosporon spelunceum]